MIHENKPIHYSFGFYLDEQPIPRGLFSALESPAFKPGPPKRFFYDYAIFESSNIWVRIISCAWQYGMNQNNFGTCAKCLFLANKYYHSEFK